MRKSLFVLSLALLSLLSACATLSGFEEPRVSLATLNLQNVNLLSQEFRLGLRVDNPNNFGVRVDGAEVEVKVNGQTLARGLSNQRVDVPRYGSAIVDVNASTSMFGLARQALSLAAGQRIPYEVNGYLRLSRGFGVRIPFQQKGELDWGTLTGAGAAPAAR
ncbi:MAG: LEA type 2 family protein [Pseudomonadota bacterium]